MNNTARSSTNERSFANERINCEQRECGASFIRRPFVQGSCAIESTKMRGLGGRDATFLRAFGLNYSPLSNVTRVFAADDGSIASANKNWKEKQCRSASWEKAIW